MWKSILIHSDARFWAFFVSNVSKYYFVFCDFLLTNKTYQKQTKASTYLFLLSNLVSPNPGKTHTLLCWHQRAYDCGLLLHVQQGYCRQTILRLGSADRDETPCSPSPGWAGCWGPSWCPLAAFLSAHQTPLQSPDPGGVGRPRCHRFGLQWSSC